MQKCRNVEMWDRMNTVMTKCRNVEMSKCRNVEMLKCRNVEMYNFGISTFPHSHISTFIPESKHLLSQNA